MKATTQVPKYLIGQELWVQTTVKGSTRYSHYDHSQMRYFPIKKEVASAMIKAGNRVTIKQAGKDWICQGAAV